MVRSGLCWAGKCTGGLGFWGPNGHDAIWHLSLINNFTKGNFDSPIFSGWGIQNYHIGYDLFLSWIVRLTTIPSSVLYFQIIPPILAFLIGVLTYKFVYLWRGSKSESLLATFFVYFGGSFGWLVSFIRGEGWGGESMFWSQQSISTLINPSFALSLVFILLGLIFLIKHYEKKRLLYFILCILFFGVVIEIKVYAGLIALTSLLGVSLWQVIRKKNFSTLWIAFASIAISAVLFIPSNKSSAGLISLAPFWFLESMMTLSDRFGWEKLYSAMTTYKMGHVWLKGILAYGLAFVIFIIGNFGTRIIGLGSLLRNRKKIFSAGPVEVFLFIIILAGITVPMLFVQKGTPWNTIQFFYYSLIFGGIVAGVEVGKIIRDKNIKIQIMTVFILVIFTIPTTIASLGNFLPPRPQSILPADEVEALRFLSGEPNGVVLTYPFDEEKAAKAVAPRPLYLYAPTAYVSAFSGKPVFLEDQINLDIMQYPWIERRMEVEEFLATPDIDSAKNFLKENKITYVYWLEGQHAREGGLQLGLTQIFKNGSVTIYRVN